MTNYKEIILNLLLDKYERSKSFTGDNKVEQRFSVKIAALFPKYGDEAEYDLFNALNEAVIALSEMDFVSFQCKKNGVIENVSLKFTRLYDAYAYLTRTPKAETNRNLIGLLEQYDGKSDLLTRFCTVQKERIAKNKKAEYFDGDIAEYEKLLKAVSMIFDVAEETFIRDFSIRVFGDSKSFEAIKGKVKRLLFQYGDFPDEETVLEDLNIVKNPGHIYMKGSALIQISGQTIDLSKLNGDIAISSALLPDIERIIVTGKRVLTIENLTSFHAFSEKDTFAVYLGGYHNTHRRRFIQQLFKDNPTAIYYHFGDIDAGGFYILLHLRNKTGVPFSPYHMDIPTLQQYRDYTKPLTESDVKRLKKLADTEFSDTINYMLTNNCKLEQEAMDV
ncbi:Wadjet anti-phage system protein JetD domain-containing protein [uncultured Ruminococcus sp.]|uniref:Wadjet anti-phage system protein JetD domain-containing protein n=1 Tax=uncultured Ruminococcus sp. TaxID=165186 RepID=UPI0025DF549F|nr:Wadjet anti-phage system protein JetD domain-containing protein [uncultured Ruminococcus sp.]